MLVLLDVLLHLRLEAHRLQLSPRGRLCPGLHFHLNHEIRGLQHALVLRVRSDLWVRAVRAIRSGIAFAVFAVSGVSPGTAVHRSGVMRGSFGIRVGDRFLGVGLSGVTGAIGSLRVSGAITLGYFEVTCLAIHIFITQAQRPHPLPDKLAIITVFFVAKGRPERVKLGATHVGLVHSMGRGRGVWIVVVFVMSATLEALARAGTGKPAVASG